MPKLDALFPGFESFMENDVEINNEINVPEAKDDTLDDAAAAVTNETDSGELNTEGAELVGEAKNDVTEAEAAAMVFDQMFNMYNHVKQFGIDRTFLSLYNRSGKLNELVNFQFPSCESLDCVGSPSSKISQAFLIAMEDENGGIFTKFKDWIAGIFKRIKKLISRVLEWFRDKFMSTGSRIDKLKSKLRSVEFCKKDEIDKDDELPDLEAYTKLLTSGDVRILISKAQKCSKMIDSISKALYTGNSTAIGTAVYDGITSLNEMLEKRLKEAKKCKAKAKDVYNKFGKPSAYLSLVNTLETSYKSILTLRRELSTMSDKVEDTAKNVENALTASLKNKHTDNSDILKESRKRLNDYCKTTATEAQHIVFNIIQTTHVIERIYAAAIGAIARHVIYFSK
jgi:hypothetical protein